MYMYIRVVEHVHMYMYKLGMSCLYNYMYM